MHFSIWVRFAISPFLTQSVAQKQMAQAKRGTGGNRDLCCLLEQLILTSES
jgi:hypothetical protein